MKKFFILLTLIGILLLIPLIAMQFSQEVNWSISDFVIMGFLLFALGSAIILLQNIKNKKYRFLFIAMAFATFLLIWAEMAVGIFNTPLAGS